MYVNSVGQLYFDKAICKKDKIELQMSQSFKKKKKMPTMY